MPNRISHLLALVTSVLTLGLTTAAQSAAPPECPTITVTGPAGLPDPGGLIPFYAQVLGKVPSGITYKWRVSTGKIVEGQGTDKAKFDVGWPTGATLIATVEGMGLPEGCPNTASDKLAVAIDPGPIHVGSSGEPRAYGGLVNELIEELGKYPGSQGYIFIGTASSDRYKRIEEFIRATASENDFDQSRITVRRETTSKELVEMWVIRPSVDNPFCRACDELACPRVSVSGPAGYVSHGIAIVFSINADLPNLENLKYEWTATAGKIDQGQGSPHLYVITSNADGGKELKVKVRVTGLPQGCPDTAEFVYGEVPLEGDPVMFDEYGSDLSVKDELERLDLAAAEWKSEQSHSFYFILYRGPNESLMSERTRIKRIRDHLTIKRRMPAEKVVIVKGGIGPRRSTHVYKVPSDSDWRPTP